MFRRLSRFLGLASVLGFALPNAEADAADAPGVTLELLAETSAIQPGEPFQVGLRIRHASGWHTYWRHPGIVGVPTRLQWDLPPGFRAGPIQWPYPERVRMAIYTAYGFERDVLLPVTITPPPRLKPGNTVTLRASAHWMACAATCHPGNREFVLQLPVDPNATGKSGEHRQLFARSRADRPSPLSGWTGIPGRSEDRLTLAATLPTRFATAARETILLLLRRSGSLRSPADGGTSSGRSAPVHLGPGSLSPRRSPGPIGCRLQRNRVAAGTGSNVC